MPATRPDVPSVRDVARCDGSASLPPEGPAVPIPTKALQAPSPTGPVLAHLDPGQLRAPEGAATVERYSPVRIDTYHTANHPRVSRHRRVTRRHVPRETLEWQQTLG